MNFTTADLCDEFESLVKIAKPLFQDYGQLKSYYGEIATVKVFEDNVLVRKTLESEGRKRILVVDGGASMKVALVGDQLGQIAYDSGWTGIVVNGCIRDSAEIARIPIGLKALNTIPKKSIKKGLGEVDVSVEFAGLVFNPGDYLYADLDGVIVSEKNLLKIIAAKE